MNRTKEIELLPNMAYHTMEHNGYIKSAIIVGDCYYLPLPYDSYYPSIYKNIIMINFNKEYFN